MNSDLLLWMILAATTVQSAAWIAASSNNRQLMALAREHKVELRVSPGLTGFSIVMGLPIAFGVIGRVASLGKVRQP